MGWAPKLGGSSRLQPLLANKGVDPSVKALEAALGAINKMLSAHQALTAGRQGRKSPGADQQQPGAAGQARRPKGKGKVISFKAEASATRPVQELFPCLAAAAEAAAVAAAAAAAESPPPPDTPDSTTGSSSSSSSTWPSTSAASPTPPSAAAEAGQAPAPDLSRSLKAYLSLPLDQYSVLDPRYIIVLPEDWDPATHVSSSSSSGASSSSSSSSSEGGGAASAAPLNSNTSSSADAGPGPESSSSSSSSSSHRGADSSRSIPAGTTGHAADIPMRPLDAPAASSSAVTPGDADGPPDAPPSNPGQPTPAVQSMPSILLPPGCTAANFLLRVPLADVVGVDLTPELVFRVEADTSEGQVTFTTRYLKTGEPAVDKDLQMDIHAELDSQLLQAAALQANPVEAPGEVAAATGSSSSSSSSSGSSSSASSSSAAASSGDASDTATASTPQQDQDQQQQQGTLSPPAPAKWQQQSQLRSHVSLKMRLMVGYPLSIVPGPLLSATASLVAQLTMKALLPSFLDLLGTDYGRWASGTSTSSRQALPAGDLLRQGAASGSASSSSPVSGSYSASAGGESSSNSSMEDGTAEAASSSSSGGGTAAVVAVTSASNAHGS